MQQPLVSKDQAWKNLRKYAESLAYGRIEVVIKDGMPVQGDTPMKNVKFDKPGDDEFKTTPMG